MPRLSAPLAALVTLTSLTACGPSVDSLADPRGSDATFNFSWKINGQDPTAAADPCATAGIAFIRMTVVDRLRTEHHYDTFRYDCRQGNHRSSGPELRAGTFFMYWEAIDAAGNRVSVAPGTYDAEENLRPSFDEVTVAPGAHIDLDEGNRPDPSDPAAPTNFATGLGTFTAQLRFAATPGAAAGVSCSEAGVATVRWTLRLSNNVPIAQRSTPETCSAASDPIQQDAIAFDNYTLEVLGFDSTGQEAWRGRCTDLLLTTADGAPHTCLIDRVIAP